MRTIVCFFILLNTFTAFSQDTLRNFDWNGPMNVYNEQDISGNHCGYTIGQSCRHYEVFAERYDISDSAEVMQIVSYHTGKIQNPGRQVAFEIYSVGEDKMPDILLASKPQSYRNLVATGNPVTTSLFEPAKVGRSFFVALNFLDYAHEDFTDTIAILSSPDGSRPDAELSDVGRNVLRVHHYDFEDLYGRTDLKVHLALFPVVRFPVVSSIMERSVSNGTLKVFSPYPNPCINEVTLSYDLAKPSEVTWEIFDANGKQLLSGDLGYRKAGLHTEKVNTSSLPTGSFTLIVRSSGSVIGMNLIK